MLNIRKSSDQAAAPPSLPIQSPPPVPAAGAQPASWQRQSGGPSVIGTDLTVVGNLVSRGEVHVEGEIQGDIHGTHVVVGEKAKITGAIIAEEIVVRGHVMGSVRGKRVMLQATSHVEGDVYHQALAIEQGAFFEGKSRRSEDPTAGVPRPEMPDFSTRGSDQIGIAPAISMPES